jgi:hypothetical protein
MQSINAILLIHKKLTNQISSKEKKILKSWLKDDPQNKILFKDISLIWEASKNSFDPSNYTDSSKFEKPENNHLTSDISDGSYLFDLSTKHEQNHLDQKFTKTILNEEDDLFSQLMLSDLSSSELTKLQNIHFNAKLKPIIQILSSTAKIILSGETGQYHLDVLQALEQFSSINGIIISDKDDKVKYATNKKLKHIFLFEVVPVKSFLFEKLNISKVYGYQLLAMPVYHLYGRIGMVFLILR